MHFRFKKGVHFELIKDGGVISSASSSEKQAVSKEEALYLKELAACDTVFLDDIALSVASELGEADGDIKETEHLLRALSVIKKYYVEGYVERDLAAEKASGKTSGSTIILPELPEDKNE